jgi:heat shock protein 1/8
LDGIPPASRGIP